MEMPSPAVAAADGEYPGLCRLCVGYCPIMVTVRDGRAVKVTGDPAAPLFDGYTCPKGRALPDLHYGPQRLLHCLRGDGAGQFERLSSEAAIVEIAARLEAIIAKHGPNAVAVYYGTGATSSTVPLNVAKAWLTAIGSDMCFSVNTIDKPGMQVAQARHGMWEAGHPPFEQAEAWVLIGSNPVISKTGGFPQNNPGRRLKEAIARGMKLIVIDPRRNEVAKKAHVHLQCRPGHDPHILAAMIHVIIAEELCDKAFVATNARGLDDLRQAVADFTPDRVASAAGIDADDIVEAARIYAVSRASGIFCGTGPSFATRGTLTEYLANCLTTLCGHWAKAGDVLQKPNVLLPAWRGRAQPTNPFPEASGRPLRVRGLRGSVSGLPASAIADEILLEGEGQIKALICLGGNPLMAFPDQQRTFDAFKSLDLLVTLDPEMNATARISHYVLPPTLVLETPGTSLLMENIKYSAHSRGIDAPYARYAPALVAPPEGSDLMGDWEFFYELGRQMGLRLTMQCTYRAGNFEEAPPRSFTFDPERRPSTDELFEMIFANSRIPFDRIKSYPHGHVFEEVDEKVGERDPSCTAMLDIGNGTMMAELGELAGEMLSPPACDAYPLRLVPRRVNHLINSYGRGSAELNSRAPFNPIMLNPQDAAQLGLGRGDEVRVESRHGAVRAIVDLDDAIKAGVASMAHCYGGNPDEPDDPRGNGASVNRLLSVDDDPDPVNGIPRMGALPIRVVPCPAMP